MRKRLESLISFLYVDWYFILVLLAIPSLIFYFFIKKYKDKTKKNKSIIQLLAVVATIYFAFLFLVPVPQFQIGYLSSMIEEIKDKNSSFQAPDLQSGIHQVCNENSKNLNAYNYFKLYDSFIRDIKNHIEQEGSIIYWGPYFSVPRPQISFQKFCQDKE